MSNSLQPYGLFWSGLPFPSPWALSDPGSEPGSLTLRADSLPLSHQGSPFISLPGTKTLRCLLSYPPPPCPVSSLSPLWVPTSAPATGLMGRPLPPHQDFFPLILLPLLLRLALQPTSSPSEFKQVALFCFSSPSVASLSPIPPSPSSAFFLSLLPPCTSTLCFIIKTA